MPDPLRAGRAGDRRQHVRRPRGRHGRARDGPGRDCRPSRVSPWRVSGWCTCEGGRASDTHRDPAARAHRLGHRGRTERARSPPGPARQAGPLDRPQRRRALPDRAPGPGHDPLPRGRQEQDAGQDRAARPGDRVRDRRGRAAPPARPALRRAGRVIVEALRDVRPGLAAQNVGNVALGDRRSGPARTGRRSRLHTSGGSRARRRRSASSRPRAACGPYRARWRGCRRRTGGSAPRRSGRTGARRTCGRRAGRRAARTSVRRRSGEPQHSSCRSSTGAVLDRGARPQPAGIGVIGLVHKAPKSRLRWEATNRLWQVYEQNRRWLRVVRRVEQN